MSRRWKILLLYILIFGLGYLLSIFVPIEIFKGKITEDNLTTGDYYNNLISAIAAIGTIAAVIVALFHDKIKGFFNKVEFKIALASEQIEEQLEETSDTQKKAKKYYATIVIENFGNVAAEKCELYIEKIEFRPNGRPSINMVSTTSALTFGSDYMASGGEKKYEILQITPPSSLPDTGGTSPTLIIASTPHRENRCDGIWNMHFLIQAINAKPKRFTVSFEWTGIWQDRKTEMVEIAKIKLGE